MPVPLAIEYAPEFVRTWKKLPVDHQDEVLDRIELFKNRDTHAQLRVHKLTGAMRGKFSFSINFKYRLIFIYKRGDKNTAQLLDIGDHSVYE